MSDHYETLGVGRDADAREIRRAFGRLAKELHPDRNPSAEGAARFLVVKEAYEVLSDPERRNNHDAVLRLREEISRRKEDGVGGMVQAGQKPASQGSAGFGAGEREVRDEKAEWLAAKERMERLTWLMNTNRLADAEELVEEILRSDGRNAVAYAAKGDIARIRGDFATAQKCYAYAAQFDSRNPVYQRKFEQTVSAAERGERQGPQSSVVFQPVPGMVATFVVLVGAVYPVLANEPPLLPGAALANTLTLGMLVMLFISGVTMGACLTISGVMDPIGSALGTAVAKIPPAITLGFVAVVNYWLALGLYLLVGATPGAFNRNLSRLLGYSGLAVGVFAVAQLTQGGVAFLQVLGWGGNLVYIGAACGWFVADGLGRVVR